ADLELRRRNPGAAEGVSIRRGQIHYTDSEGGGGLRMKFSKTSLIGLCVIDLELREDDRGFLARTYCQNEFAEHGLNIQWPQCNLTLTKQRGMLRGMHFQAE